MSNQEIFLHFPTPQRDAIFVSRPQRFLAQMAFIGDPEEIVYCPNSGSMTGLLIPGSRTILWDSCNLKRKRRYTWRAIELNGCWVGTDTHLSNRIVEVIIRKKLLSVFNEFTDIKCEQIIEKGVRVDFVLKNAKGNCLIEVKSASVADDGVVRYPDSKTSRGIKQLRVLASRAKAGQRVMMLFLAQRSDVNSFLITNSFDLDYAIAFDEAIAAGVEVMGIAVTVCVEGFSAPRLLPYNGKVIASVSVT